MLSNLIKVNRNPIIPPAIQLPSTLSFPAQVKITSLSKRGLQRCRSFHNSLMLHPNDKLVLQVTCYSTSQKYAVNTLPSDYTVNLSVCNRSRRAVPESKPLVYTFSSKSRKHPRRCCHWDPHIATITRLVTFVLHLWRMEGQTRSP